MRDFACWPRSPDKVHRFIPQYKTYFSQSYAASIWFHYRISSRQIIIWLIHVEHRADPKPSNIRNSHSVGPHVTIRLHERLKFCHNNRAHFCSWTINAISFEVSPSALSSPFSRSYSRHVTRVELPWGRKGIALSSNVNQRCAATRVTQKRNMSLQKWEVRIISSSELGRSATPFSRSTTLPSSSNRTPLSRLSFPLWNVAWSVGF